MSDNYDLLSIQEQRDYLVAVCQHLDPHNCKYCPFGFSGNKIKSCKTPSEFTEKEVRREYRQYCYKILGSPLDDMGTPDTVDLTDECRKMLLNLSIDNSCSFNDLVEFAITAFYCHESKFTTKCIMTDFDSEKEDDPYADYCYECGGYGDDYSVDENGELVSNCDDCPFNPAAADPYDD